MTISSISYYSSGALADFMVNDQSQQASRVDQEIAGLRERVQTKSSGKNAYIGSGGASSSAGQAALKQVIQEMEGMYDGKLTFAKIAEYKKDQEELFTMTTRVELAKLGVSPEQDFTISMSPEGSISVKCDDPEAKKIIEQYLSDNPEACERFGYLQALGNLERARQTPLASTLPGGGSSTALLQGQILDAFFGEATSSFMDYSSLTAAYSGSSKNISFYAGLGFKV